MYKRCLSFQRNQTGSEAHPTPKLTDDGRRFSPRVRSPGVKSSFHLQHLTSRIIICEVVQLRPLCLHGLRLNSMEVIFLNEGIVQDPSILTNILQIFCDIKLWSVISGFRREVGEKWTLFWVVTQRVVVIYYDEIFTVKVKINFSQFPQHLLAPIHLHLNCSASRFDTLNLLPFFTSDNPLLSRGNETMLPTCPFA